MGPDSSRTEAAIAARRGRTQIMLTQVEKAISQLVREQGRVTVRSVAHRAGVSSTFIYENAEARNLVQAATKVAAARRERSAEQESDRIESGWRERALNAEDALKRTQAEIQVQRRRIGELMGQLRDTSQTVDGESIQRLATENTTLKRQLGELTREHRALRERLEGARTNLRFTEKRVADLEVQLLEVAQQA